jgi:hypothetical protein
VWTIARRNGIGYHSICVCDLGAYTPKEEDEGETSGVAVEVACSRHRLIASPANVATMQACGQGNDSLAEGTEQMLQEAPAWRYAHFQ